MLIDDIDDVEKCADSDERGRRGSANWTDTQPGADESDRCCVAGYRLVEGDAGEEGCGDEAGGCVCRTAHLRLTNDFGFVESEEESEEEAQGEDEVRARR